MVSLNQGGQGRVAHSSQDAIASILASMNNQVRYYLFLLLLKELRWMRYAEKRRNVVIKHWDLIYM